MNPETYRRLQSLFAEASKLPDSDRAEFLDTHCPDPAMRRHVERLLAADARDDALFETPPPGESSAEAGVTVNAWLDHVPERIGNYRILRRLGEGGMGSVYAAEQDQPRRTVALKVLHVGLLTPAMLRRFEFEGEVLAQLQHPGIAHIYDAGTAELAGTTLPYFAMELVQGVTITKHADVHELDMRARLELVVRVADALEHAHQKGIIHRDLKPQNILVDATGQPKILDFGIARTAQADGRSQSMVTASGMLVGTLAYMSPEQASGDARALDTRSDVYSLGVLTYELLVGRLPYDVGQLPITRAAQVISEQEPVRPGTLRTNLRGDVETILLKALEKDKDRRYSSSAAFAADVRAFLNDEPIQARRATTAYQLSKFARRHKGLVAGLIATFAALVVGLVVSLTFYFKSEDALKRAVDAGRAETAERQRAERAALRAESSNRFFLREMMAAPDPWAASGKDVTVASILDRIERNIRESLGHDAELESDAQVTIAGSFLARGMYDKAVEHATRGLELRRSLHAEDHRDVAAALFVLAKAQWERGDLKSAETNTSDALELYTRLPDTPEETKVEVTAQLARVHLAKGEHAKALAEFGDVLARQIRLHGELHPETVRANADLASAHLQAGQVAEAETYARKVLATRRVLQTKDSPFLAVSLNDLAAILYEKGDDAANQEVVDLYRESRAILERELGPEHRLSLLTQNNEANALVRIGEVEAAEKLQAKVVEAMPKVVGVEHSDYLQALNSHGHALFTLGRIEEAEAEYEKAIELSEKALGPNHSNTLRPMSNLAYLEKGRGLKTAKKRESDGVFLVEPDSDLARAREHFRRAREGFLQLYGPRHRVLMSVLYGFADLEYQTGEYRSAAALFGEHAETMLACRTEDYESAVTEVLYRRGMSLLKAGAPEEAEPVFRDAVERSRRVFPEKDWRTAISASAHGECLTQLKRYAEAEPLLLECHGVFEPLKAKRAAEFAKVRRRLAALYDAQNEPEKAAPYRSGT